MSLLLTALSLRALVGIVGVGVSLLKADFASPTPTVTNELCKNILTGTLSGTIYDLLKGSTISTIEQIARRFTDDIDNPLNHDLQRAARKAQLTATLLAIRAAQKDLPKDRWLKRLTNLLQAEINNLPNETPEIVGYDDILRIFDTREQSVIQQDLVKKLKEDTINELFKLGAEKNLPDFSSESHELLVAKIVKGWDETKTDDSFLAKFKSFYSKEQKENLISTTRQYDWFSLMCGFFNEEYKDNDRVSQAMQKYLLLDLRDKNGESLQLSDAQIESLNKVFLGNLEQFSDSFESLKGLLQTIDTKQDAILGFVKSSFKDLKETVERTAQETRDTIHATVGKTEVKLFGRFDKTDKSNDEIKEQLIKIEGLLQERDQQIPSKPVQKAKLKPVEKYFFLLKERYQKRYQNKLDKRFEISLEVNQNWEISEKFNENASDGKAIDVIGNLFQEEGRLLIVGNAGVGKTVLLLKLAIDLLNRTDIYKEEAFPVIFNLASWSEDYADFKDWLIAMLHRGEGLSPKTAKELLEQDRIIFLLDGLDELARNQDEKVAEKTRAKCLDSLADYLDYGKKTVICCRVDEFVQMQNDTGQKAPVDKKVRVLDLTKDKIISALEEARHHKESKTAAKNLTEILTNDQSGVFLLVLRTSFYFTTALEVFDRPIIKETDFPLTEIGLKRYLIEKFIERKITKNQTKKFRRRDIIGWLRRLAQLMKKKDKVTFELADLQPNDLRRPWVFKSLLSLTAYILFYSPIVIFLLVLLLIDLFSPQSAVYPFMKSVSNAFYSSPKEETAFYLVLILLLFTAFIALFLPFGLLFGFRTKEILTEDSSSFSLLPLLKWETWKSILSTSFLYGLIMTLIFLVFSVFQPVTFAEKLRVIAGAFFIVFSFTMMERISNFSRTIKKFGNLRTDYQRLRTGIIYNLIRWNIVLLCFVIFGNISAINNLDILNLRPMLLFLPFILILILVNTALFQHFLLRICLAFVGILPLRYATFLNYAADARLLEKDGGFWRFRHQELQDYFAGLR